MFKCIPIPKTKHASSILRTKACASRYHLISLFHPKGHEGHKGEKSALSPDGHPAVPVTGDSRDGLLGRQPFFVNYSRRLQRCFPAETSTVCLLLYQVTVHLLLLEVENIIRAGKLPVKPVSLLFSDNRLSEQGCLPPSSKPHRLLTQFFDSPFPTDPGKPVPSGTAGRDPVPPRLR
jgi:hypothetical protein